MRIEMVDEQLDFSQLIKYMPYRYNGFSGSIDITQNPMTITTGWQADSVRLDFVKTKDLFDHQKTYLASCVVDLATYKELTTNVTSDTIDRIAFMIEKLKGKDTDPDILVGIYPAGKNLMRQRLENVAGNYSFKLGIGFDDLIDLTYQFLLATNVLYPIGSQTSAHIFIDHPLTSLDDVFKYNNEYSFVSAAEFYMKLNALDKAAAEHNDKALGQTLGTYKNLVRALQAKLKELQEIPINVTEFYSPYHWS